MRFWMCLLLPLLAVSAIADNTIYRCKNDKGEGFIYQQNPCADDQVVGTDLPHKLWRQTRQLTGEKTEALQQLGADVESIKQCQKRMKKLNKKTDALASQIDAIRLSHNKIAKAYGYLKECGECRTSAVSACQQAEIFLQRATVDLMEY